VVIWLAHGRIGRSWQPTSLRNARAAKQDSGWCSFSPRRERKALIQLKYDPLFEHLAVPASGKKRVPDARDTADPMVASIDIWSKEHR
jgi:hypothetical protein